MIVDHFRPLLQLRQTPTTIAAPRTHWSGMRPLLLKPESLPSCVPCWCLDGSTPSSEWRTSWTRPPLSTWGASSSRWSKVEREVSSRGLIFSSCSSTRRWARQNWSGQAIISWPPTWIVMVSDVWLQFKCKSTHIFCLIFSATLADEAGSKSVGCKNKLSDKEIVSQCMLFFAAGFGTTSDALTVLLHCFK